jgi:hypothetical protein
VGVIKLLKNKIIDIQKTKQYPFRVVSTPHFSLLLLTPHSSLLHFFFLFSEFNKEEPEGSPINHFPPG